MASVLEKRERKTFLDDTIPLAPTITTHRMETSGKQSHAVRTVFDSLTAACTCVCVCVQAYVIKVQRGQNPDDSWEVSGCVSLACV